MLRAACFLMLMAVVACQFPEQDGQVFEVDVEISGPNGLPSGMSLPDPEMLRQIVTQLSNGEGESLASDIELPSPEVLQQIMMQLLNGEEVTVPEGVQIPNAEMLQQLVKHLNGEGLDKIQMLTENMPSMEEAMSEQNELVAELQGAGLLQPGLQLTRPDLMPEASEIPQTTERKEPRQQKKPQRHEKHRPFNADPSFYTLGSGPCKVGDAFNVVLQHCEIILDTTAIENSQACGDRRCKHAIGMFVEESRRPECSDKMDESTKALTSALAAQKESIKDCSEVTNGLYGCLPYIIFGLLALSGLLLCCMCARACCSSKSEESRARAYGNIQEEPASGHIESVAIPVAHPSAEAPLAYPVAYPSV